METEDRSVSRPVDTVTAAPAAAPADTVQQTIKAEEPPTHSLQPAIPTLPAIALPQEDTAKDKTRLHFNKPFLAAHSAYIRSQPHPDNDLIEQYGLQWLARTVARTDPVTGEKINKIRKSYEGQIKAFALAGRNKAIKWDPSQGPSIKQLAQAPPEDYYNSRVVGKEVSRGISSASMSRLQKVLNLAPGPVPRNAEWENALGFDKAKNVPIEEAKVKKPEIAREVVPIPIKINGHTNGVIPGSKDSEAIRPKRFGKKRRYNDESFEGYGEGFDDADDGSSDEGSRRSLGSQQKKLKTAAASYG